VCIDVFDAEVVGDEEEEEGDLLEDEEEDMEEEPYFPHELTSPEPIYFYGRDVESPGSISEHSVDYSRMSSELTFSEYVCDLLGFHLKQLVMVLCS